MGISEPPCRSLAAEDSTMKADGVVPVADARRPSPVDVLFAANAFAQAVEAYHDCDPHEVLCSKLFKKMMEGDWRTVAKAL